MIVSVYGKRFNLKTFLDPKALIFNVLILLSMQALPVWAQNSVIKAGQVVVTNFSGVKDLSGNSNEPADELFIDPEGNSALVLQINGRNRTATGVVKPDLIYAVKAKDVGQVFSIAVDNEKIPNIYLAASSAFGVQIVERNPATGQTTRLRHGAPQAEFMQGQWGQGGTPGSIWKIDGLTNTVSLFATIPNNSGAAIGSIVFDRGSRQFFVSDLDTGLIYRLDDTGHIRDVFDHGVQAMRNVGLDTIPDDPLDRMNITDPAFNPEDTSTWGLTNPKRRVGGLDVHEARLYYTIAANNEVWSVSIREDGSFGFDAHQEFVISSNPDSTIASISIANHGALYAAFRGPAEPRYDYSAFAKAGLSTVMRVGRRSNGAWILPPSAYATGKAPDYYNGDGGVEHLCRPRWIANDQKCLDFMWSTVEAIDEANPDASSATETSSSANGQSQSQNAQPSIYFHGHGLQGNLRASVRKESGLPNDAIFVDTDVTNSGFDAEGFMGDVKIIHAASVPPPSPTNELIDLIPIEPEPIPVEPEPIPIPVPVCPYGTYGIPPDCHVDRCLPGFYGRPPNCHVARCLPGFYGRPPYCRRDCPPGTVGRPPYCHPLVNCPPGSVGTPPNCRINGCPVGFYGRPPFCHRGCPPGSIGRPPFCKTSQLCPDGMIGSPPNCRLRPRRCPPGQSGFYPNCKTQIITCPPGQIGIPPNCKIRVMVCPEGEIGTPPNCVPKIKPTCPIGQIGTPPNCKPVIIIKSCPPGQIGRPPYCKAPPRNCPAGQFGTPPHCEVIHEKKMQAHSCPAGMTGTPPRCRHIASHTITKQQIRRTVQRRQNLVHRSPSRVSSRPHVNKVPRFNRSRPANLTKHVSRPAPRPVKRSSPPKRKR